MSCWNRFGQKERPGRFDLTVRILITGGLGFVGGRLAMHLAQAGHQIVLGSRKKISPPAWLPQTEVVQLEWDDSTSLERVCNDAEVIIHAAGMNSQDCTIDPLAALEVNGVYTGRLLQAAIRQRVNRFIYISTAHVYGSPLEGTITEETCPTSLHPYATSHKAGEDLVRYAHDRSFIVGIVARLSNAFGAPTHVDANCWMLLTNDLCRQAVISGQMRLLSSGLQKRDFVSMSQVSLAICHLIKLSSDQITNSVVNVGGEWAISILEMSNLIQDRCRALFGYNPELIVPKLRQASTTGELDYRIDVLRKAGYKPREDMMGEIDELLYFCKNHI
ncbi:MAG: SDR family oxidoreductase [Rhodocyclaceae bacterium]|nr:SDR family oxidoreductase [Rhodocyclaceae bacterium]